MCLWLDCGEKRTSVMIVFKRYAPSERNNTLTNLKQLACQVFGVRIASFGHLGIISDQRMFFSSSINGLNYDKEPENINNYTIE